MKSEQEFLSAMWSEINAKEREAKQKQITHELNKRLFVKEAAAYGIIAALFSIGSAIAFFIKDNPDIVYAAALLLLSAAFFYEKLVFQNHGGIH